MGKWYWERIWVSIALSTAAVVIAFSSALSWPTVGLALALGLSSVLVCPTPP